jgi:hypothetical protein
MPSFAACSVRIGVALPPVSRHRHADQALKALFPCRATGPTTAGAVTLHTAGAVALIPASSLHTVPPH